MSYTKSVWQSTCLLDVQASSANPCDRSAILLPMLLIHRCPTRCFTATAPLQSSHSISTDEDLSPILTTCISRREVTLSPPALTAIDSDILGGDICLVLQPLVSSALHHQSAALRDLFCALSEVIAQHNDRTAVKTSAAGIAVYSGSASLCAGGWMRQYLLTGLAMLPVPLLPVFAKLCTEGNIESAKLDRAGDTK